MEKEKRLFNWAFSIKMINIKQTIKKNKTKIKNSSGAPLNVRWHSVLNSCKGNTIPCINQTKQRQQHEAWTKSKQSQT